MYLFREFNLLPVLIMAGSWYAGGWLISARLFDLKPAERHLIGFGIGMTVSIWLENLLAYVLPVPLVFWVSILATLGLGVALAWSIRKELRGMFSFDWGQWLLFAFLVFLFTLINRGLAIFDDYAYLPSISLMSAGDIPPHFPFDNSLNLGYHHFLLLIGAEFMRVGATAPWTAFDLARGLTMAMFFILGGVVAEYLTGRQNLKIWGGMFVALASGTRWLLLFFPPSIVSAISNSLNLIGATGQNNATLDGLLKGPWLMDGAGPVPFPFAFANGVFPPSIMAFGGMGVSGGVVLLLLILVSLRMKNQWAWPLVVVLLASLALSNEIILVSAAAGLFFVALFWAVKNRSFKIPPLLRNWIIVFFIGGVISIIQGGTLTEIFRSMFDRGAGSGEVYYETGFELAWPPAIVSAHLGVLSLFQPYQLIMALLEVGPLILLAPFLISRGKKAFLGENWLEASLMVSGIVGLLMMFIEYNGTGGLRNTSRLFGHYLYIGLIYAVPLVWLYLQDKKQALYDVAIAVGLVTVLSGVVLFSVQLYAIFAPVASYNLNELDVKMFEKYWNRLPSPGMVFDPIPSRAVTLFGRPTNSGFTWYDTKPEYSDLVNSPDPYKVHESGYDYMYYNIYYWMDHQELLDLPCVQIVEQVTDIHQATGESGDFRRLVDITSCTP